MAESSIPKEPLSFQWQFRQRFARDFHFQGGGRIHAWERGAKMALRGEPFKPIYRRQDCWDAEADGYNAGRDAIANGLIVICDCCGQPFPACRPSPITEKKGAGENG